MIEQDLTKIGCHGNWRRYKNNPILKDDWGETFDVTVIQVGEKLRMYLSWRSTNSIAFVEGVDGVHWSEPVIVLSPDFTTGWEDDINRQIVLEKDGKYLMWYTGMKFLGAGERMSSGRSCIGYAESEDGIHFTRRKDPVMEPEEAWEKTNRCVLMYCGMKNGIFLECGIRQEVSGSRIRLDMQRVKTGSIGRNTRKTLFSDLSLHISGRKKLFLPAKSFRWMDITTCFISDLKTCIKQRSTSQDRRMESKDGNGIRIIRFCLAARKEAGM